MSQTPAKKIFQLSLIAVSFVFLVGNVVFAAATQTGTFVLGSGAADIFYEGFNNPMTGVTFNGLGASSSDQDTIANFAGSSPWPNSAFIGIIDLEGSATTWNLSVQGPASLIDGAKTMSLSGDRLEAETTAHEWTTLTLTDSNAVNYIMTKNDGATNPNDIWYWESASYTWSDGHVTAPINVANGTDLNNAANYDTGIISSPVTILSKGSAQVLGIVGTGISFALDGPGNTPAGTYSGTITFTLS